MGYLFNGASNQVYSAAGITALNSATAVTMAATLKRQASGAIAAVGIYEGSVGFLLEIDAFNDLYAVLKDGATVTYAQVIDSTTTPTVYVMSYNGGGAANSDRLKVYRNGTLASVTYTGTIPAALSASMSSQPFRIGRDVINNRWSNAVFNEVALWNAALSQDEATLLSKGFKAQTVRPGNLLLCAPLTRSVLDITGKTSLTLEGGSVQPNHRRYG